MNKDHEVYTMIKQMKYLDIVVLSILVIICYIINKKYIAICTLGFMVSVLSFYLNAYVTEYVFNKNLEKSNQITILSYYIRIFLISIIGIAVFTYNRFNIIAYILGYTFRFFSLILYALVIKK
ncbi:MULTISPECIES: ATP synthase subunit I [Clostridium]|uniref:Predicted membrane protein in FoF1-type ATP synthase n=1 Tax=Clostridium novyi (strain NT) TaxID=386415 RepID=A0Q301_CLONN|nr:MULTISPECIES: ATP synthase subunit I [Clostridium]ABK60565.1 Predicted membrane protein in FoF1-type ATP synthase [Clostridium novyi NT]KEH86373.1 ATP synthase F0F1 [Clostridium novyi A str. 4540]KEH87014.1 ATP synthase F0F1 [Clostridium novyi A str. NCTC 538]KEH91107.1 ATP synthase F0F1 [Clostridium novyi A str. BKT29909]KEH92352.1 ATP synthase F0F1 [Clostridium novyi A str. GD211209]